MTTRVPFPLTVHEHPCAGVLSVVSTGPIIQVDISNPGGLTLVASNPSETASVTATEGATEGTYYFDLSLYTDEAFDISISEAPQAPPFLLFVDNDNDGVADDGSLGSALDTVRIQFTRARRFVACSALSSAAPFLVFSLPIVVAAVLLCCLRFLICLPHAGGRASRRSITFCVLPAFANCNAHAKAVEPALATAHANQGRWVQRAAAPARRAARLAALCRRTSAAPSAASTAKPVWKTPATARA